MRGVKGVHDSVIYLDVPHLSWISGYKFALSFEPGLLLLSNKAILLCGAPAPARPNDVERRVNEAVCLLFSPTRCLLPFLPLHPLHSSFYLPLYRNDPFVLLVDSRSINRRTTISQDVQPSNRWTVFFEIGDDEICGEPLANGLAQR